jgi:hypothetical protein
MAGEFIGKLPRNWERAFGYGGPARWLAVYWTPWGDEAEFTDGFITQDGAWWAFEALLRELPLLEEEKWSLGGSDVEPTHCLLLDLGQRDVYLTTLEEGLQVVRSQWPPMRVSEEELPALIEKLEGLLSSEDFRTFRLCNNCGGLGWIKVADGYDPCPGCDGAGWIPIEEEGRR